MNNQLDGGKTLLIGRITGTHALKGVVRVYSYAESASVFEPGQSIVAAMPTGESRRLAIKWSRPHKNVHLVCLEGVDDVDQAHELIGAELFIERSTLPELEADTYYWEDLIGLEVIDITLGRLGRLTAILPTGSNDVYVVTADEVEKGRELLIPAIASVVLGIDLEQKIIRVDLPEGLIED